MGESGRASSNRSVTLRSTAHDVTGVGHRVGYESASQFSREYRRQFGAPPSRDALRLRETVSAAVPSFP